jgi:hypothetical protein
MHPDILRELGSQRSSEMRARAQQVKAARMARKELRAGRRAVQGDGVVVPAIPDFVDGSFLATRAEEAVDHKPSRVPADRHAA